MTKESLDQKKIQKLESDINTLRKTIVSMKQQMMLMDRKMKGNRINIEENKRNIGALTGILNK